MNLGSWFKDTGLNLHRPTACKEFQSLMYAGGGYKHFDRWFGHAESVWETWQLHHDNAPAHSSQLIQTFSAKHNIPMVRQAPLLSRHGSLRFLAVPPPERDSIWVTRHYTEHDGQAVLHSQRDIPKMLRTMAEPLEEVWSVTRRLLRRALGLQTSRRVNVFFPAKGQILFEQATYFLINVWKYTGNVRLKKIWGAFWSHLWCWKVRRVPYFSACLKLIMQRARAKCRIFVSVVARNSLQNLSSCSRTPHGFATNFQLSS